MKRTKEIKAVEILSKKLECNIESGVDIEYNVYVALSGINVHHRGLLSNISGRGETYTDACKNYCDNVLENPYPLRKESDGYFCKKDMIAIISDCLAEDIDNEPNYNRLN